LRSFGRDARKETQQRQNNTVSKWEPVVEIEIHRYEILFQGSTQRMSETDTQSGVRNGVKSEDIRLQKGTDNIISHCRT
jgi:hypothetical protein